MERAEVLCSAAMDLQRYMAPLMCFKGDDILETSLLRAADNEPGESPTLPEENTLLGNDPTSEETWEITTHTSNHPKETSKPKEAARLEWTTTDTQDAQRQLPPLPLGYELPTLVSGPPPLEDVEPQARIS